MSPTSPLFPLLSILILQATATWTAYEEYVSGLSKHSTSYPSKRPLVEFSPNQPWKTFPSSPPRHKICHVPSHNDFTTDDSSYILSALQECNNGGRVVFPSNTSYVIGTALDLTFLHHIDLDIQAYIQFTNDTDYWQSHGFHHIFQNATTFFQLGGSDVNVYGGGMLDGNGQVWYDLYASNKLILRPILFGIIGLHSGVIADLRLRYSPQWYNLIANSSDLVFDGIDIAGYSRSENMAKNTDGFDTYRSENVVIQNCVVNNGDDCVSFKPNSTEILVQNLWCNGSHGISVGSLGQYPGEVDIVENVYVSITAGLFVTRMSCLTRGSTGLQYLHVQCLERCSHQGLARCELCKVCGSSRRWRSGASFEYHVSGHAD